MKKVVLFGAPFDGTTTYRPGARFAPGKIRTEMYGIETYSPYQDRDLADLEYQDDGDLDFPFGNTARVLDMIERKTSEILTAGKFPLMIGGEHLVTLGAFRAIYKKYPDVCVVHFDAHTDLRDDYLGEKLSHSTVIRRIFDITGKDRIQQSGIRSGTREEFAFAKQHMAKKIEKKRVYLTIDLDVLDPSEFPGTGTPEAGGWRFNELLDATKKVFQTCDVVGCDIVELSPSYDLSGISTALACKFLREVLLLIK